MRIRREYSGGMSTAPIPASPKTRRFTIRLLHWGWFLLAAAALLVGYGALAIWRPYQREQQIVRMIEGWGGKVETVQVLPDRLTSLLGKERIKALKVFDRVQFVDLQGRPITDVGLIHLHGLTNIASMNLRETQITDSGLAHVSGTTKVWWLDLQSTQITDAGLVHLSGLANLEYLNLVGTRVTDEGVATLRKALPHCRIGHR